MLLACTVASPLPGLGDQTAACAQLAGESGENVGQLGVTLDQIGLDSIAIQCFALYFIGYLCVHIALHCIALHGVV
jgi:hypothetical protein